MNLGNQCRKDTVWKGLKSLGEVRLVCTNTKYNLNHIQLPERKSTSLQGVWARLELEFGQPNAGIQQKMAAQPVKLIIRQSNHSGSEQTWRRQTRVYRYTSHDK